MSVFHKDENIRESYKVEEELGQGSFAIVRKATNKITGEKVAIKIFEKAELGEEDEIAL